MRFCEQERSLQFVDGNHAQVESGIGFCQAKCPHMKGSMVGACNHGDYLHASPGANLFQLKLPSFIQMVLSRDHVVQKR